MKCKACGNKIEFPTNGKGIEWFEDLDTPIPYEVVDDKK
jgi:hypothetical protein